MRYPYATKVARRAVIVTGKNDSGYEWNWITFTSQSLGATIESRRRKELKKYGTWLHDVSAMSVEYFIRIGGN